MVLFYEPITHIITQLTCFIKKTIRLILNLDYMDHCKEYFVKLNKITVPLILTIQSFLYIKKNITLFTTYSVCHQYSTQNSNKLRKYHYKYSATLHSFKLTFMKLFNKLPLHDRQLPLDPVDIQSQRK